MCKAISALLCPRVLNLDAFAGVQSWSLLLSMPRQEELFHSTWPIDSKGPSEAVNSFPHKEVQFFVGNLCLMILAIWLDSKASLMQSALQTLSCLILSCCFVSVLSDSLRPHGLQPTRLLSPWDSPGENTGVGCHGLLQGIFPTQESNPNLLHWQAGSLPFTLPDLYVESKTMPLSLPTMGPGSNHHFKHSQHCNPLETSEVVEANMCYIALPNSHQFPHRSFGPLP